MELIKYKPDIREKVLRFGLSYPENYELVMLILGSGTKDMPVDVLARKIVKTLEASNPEEWISRLLKLKGVGQGKALAVAAAIELGKRLTGHFGAHISSPCELVPFVKHYGMNSKEHFLAVTLNGAHDIIEIHVVSVGTINRTLIHPREVFVEAIRENAAAIILCHNHPSGNPMPSKDDIATTESMIEASTVIGIPILDHIIICRDGYYSFMENKLLFKET